ncbi:MAG TPA: hypothetical protein GX702_13435 [Chloroflexi bacterium]|jgi:hypothetical protein|nr:hypothetical protein [Chloroflexota bacterium]
MDRFDRRVWVPVLLALILLLAGCQNGPAAEPTEEPPTATVMPSITPESDDVAFDLTTEAPTPPPSSEPSPETAMPRATATASAASATRPAPVGPTPQALPADRNSNIGPYLLSHPEAGQPTHELLKNSRMRAYMAINPAHWTAADLLPHMEGYGRNWIPAEEELAYIADGAAGARAYYARFEETYIATRETIHAWMSTWAFEFGDREFARSWVEFQREWLRLMHANGYRAGVGGFKTHRFGEGEILWLAPAIAAADYLFLSESGAPTIMDSVGRSTLLYRDLVAELEDALERVPEVILDISVDGQVLAELDRPGGPWWQRGYIQFETSKEDYMADVRAYDLATLEDPYVRHVFWFATNVTADTHSFDVDTNMLAVADGWHAGEER